MAVIASVIAFWLIPNSVDCPNSWAKAIFPPPEFNRGIHIPDNFKNRIPCAVSKQKLLFSPNSDKGVSVTSYISPFSSIKLYNKSKIFPSNSGSIEFSE